MCEKCKLNDKFNPKDFEGTIYSKWEEKGYFKPSEDKSKKSYCIMMPPPNVTGKLHMGHALDGTIQDILIRYKRMKGFNTLWLPGTDHSSISTEVKIVQQLKEEGLKKIDVGRESFLERTWEWTKIYGGAIVNQQKKLGCSCDWSRSRFTLDEGLSKAVQTVFINLYNKGLIYKGKRMVNWCTECKTPISDVEIEYKEEKTHLWHIKYPIKDTNEFIIVATTRPETMLGDTGVAVHPDDERYKNLIGKKAILPIMNKEIPIIEDRFVETSFGTGAVKLTPAHDMNDYNSGIQNGLEIVEVFDSELIMNDLVPEYKGLKAIEAREKIVQRLEKEGYLLKIEDYTHNVAKCDRCHNTIEPMISEQWFVKMKELAEPALKAVRDGDIKFVPERYNKTYFHWMENILDWCISRQLWWGHRIPAYYCEECGEIHVGESIPERCKKCGNEKLVQEEDTLDTWFSSALWPFSTLGWPEKTKDMEMFYPTNVLVTGYDIINPWVARMIFSGLEHANIKPFSDVLIHGIVKDSQGRKMSKSLGNGIDPIEIIDQYGTDSLRFSLILGISPGNDIKYMPEKLEQASNFSNKLWNASKFVLMNLEEIEIKENIDIENLQYEDKWILSRLNTIVKEVENNIENYDLGVALDKIYTFIWNDFCDWYIEIVKSRLYDKESKTRLEAGYTLNEVLKTSLKLLHPFMPFITEEIYTKLYNVDETIMISDFPLYKKEYEFKNEEKSIEDLKQIITNIRTVRTEMNVHPSRKSKLIFVTKKYKDLIEKSEGFLLKLGFGKEIKVEEHKENMPVNAISIVSADIEVYIPFEDLVDIEEERKRLDGEKKKLESEVSRGEKMLSNPGFVNKAPESKIKEEKEKLENYKKMLETINERLEAL